MATKQVIRTNPKIPKKTLLKNIVNQDVRRMMELIKQNPAQLTWFQSEAKRWLNTLIDNFKQNEEILKTQKNFNIYYPGHVYCWSYTARGYLEETLDWYDAFPMTLILEKTSEYMLGFNFHHVKMSTRFFVLKKLIQVFGEKYANDLYMRPINYDIFMRIVGNSRKDVKCGIRKYLRTQVQSFHGMKYMRIPNTDLPNAMLFSQPKLIGIDPASHKQWMNENSL